MYIYTSVFCKTSRVLYGRGGGGGGGGGGGVYS